MAITLEQIKKRAQLVKANKKTETYLRIVLRQDEVRGLLFPTQSPFGSTNDWLEKWAYVLYDDSKYQNYSLLTDLTWEDEYDKSAMEIEE